MRFLGKTLIVGSLLGLTAVGSQSCRQGNNARSNLFDQTKPLDSGVSSLQRRSGQKDFLSLVEEYVANKESANLSDGRNRSALEAAPGGRAEVLADVFSLEGDRLVVLTPGRGLTIVKGLKRDETGKSVNFDKVYKIADPLANQFKAELLYQWPGKDILVVIGELRTDKGTSSVARLVDASEGGKYTSSIDLPENVLDHRLITDADSGVLYVASAGQWEEGGSQPGLLSAFKVSADGFSAVGSPLKLDRTIASGEVLQISKTTVNGESKFYLGAPLATQWKYSIDDNGRYTWSTKTGGLILVDISDANGAFGKVYEIPVSGSISKRGFTQWDGAKLSVGSQTTLNGWPVAAAEQAVITGSEEVVSQADAEKLIKAFDEGMKTAFDSALEQKRKELKDPKAELTLVEQRNVYGANYQKLVSADGLATKLVKKGNRLIKLKMDWSELIVTDLGEGSRVNDVRFIDNLMQITWAPVNNKDPVSIYNLGSAESKPYLVGMVTFDSGVFQRILPFKIKNPVTGTDEQYVVGYGRESNGTDNQQVPMVRAFLLVPRPSLSGDNEFKPVEVAHKVIGDAQTQLEYRSQDRYVLFEANSTTGKVNLLIQAAKYGDGKYDNGGIFVGLDLGKTFQSPVSASNSEIVSVSPFISGNEIDDVYRMFYSSGKGLGDSITALGKNATFFAGPKDTSNKVSTVIGTIELIKNVQWYATVSTGGLKQVQQKGVQFVAKSYKNKGTGFDARLVDLNNVDASKYEALQTDTFIPGSYLSHYNAKNGELLVATSTSTYTYDAKTETNKIEVTLYVTALTLSINEEGKTILNASTVTTKTTDHISAVAIAPSSTDENTVIIAASSYTSPLAVTLLRSAGQTTVVKIDDGASLDRLDDTQTSKVLSLAGSLYLYIRVPVTLKDNEGKAVGFAKNDSNRQFKLLRDYLLPIEANDGDIVLGQATNVPGEPLDLVGGSYLLTSDHYATEVEVKKPKVDEKTGRKLDSKELTEIVRIESDTQYTLVALNGAVAKYNGGRYDLAKSRQTFFPMVRESRGSIMPRRIPRQSAGNVTALNDNQFAISEYTDNGPELALLRVSDNASLVKQGSANLGEYFSELKENASWNILKTVHRSGKSDLLVLSSGYSGATLLLAKVEKKGTLQELSVERQNGTFAESKTLIQLSSAGYYGLSANQINVDLERSIINVVDQGLGEVREYTWAE